eukprot:CAMPEP_0185553666 /NCGR_PEP_ID=MMETSP1381-20130426/38693_1 /TAXON_ID=298111 /ORGANISM="Pavlova sp., Strain CCMP459" /LENGTH=30 /DNA_ID= /DNA_START= /DNA_END= /DNA_ORIENTATION=
MEHCRTDGHGVERRHGGGQKVDEAQGALPL